LKPADPKSKPTTYADAGVDISAGERVVEMFRESVRSTFRPEVVGDIGGFGGAFAFDQSRYREPLLVFSTDGAGTKVIVAQQAGIHDTVGIDLVAMSVNDVAAHGAEPLVFLDYIVIDKLVPGVVEEIVKGIAAGCRDAGCTLIGGEVAEHPGHLHPGSYDLAGFCTGVVERSELLTGKSITPGDVIIGMASSGIHANGFSLVRKVLLHDMMLELDHRPIGFDHTLAEELLKPTFIYSGVMTALHREGLVKGFANITGGGLPGNLPRILPEDTRAEIESTSWEAPRIFELIASLGQVSRAEMFSTFNMGIGMTAVVSPRDSNHVLDLIRSRGFQAFEIGSIKARDIDGDGVRVRIE